jgi:hypothetical protein
MGTLAVFSQPEQSVAHTLLASQVAVMMGRKFEEGDWGQVYCHAKGIPLHDWSNLNIDVAHEGLGVEHKMLCVKSDRPIKENCGTSLMHPAATRSIRIPELKDATRAARNVLGQYVLLINERTAKVRTVAGKADMRFGWLLWQDNLHEFLYWEEPMTPPNPDDYIAEWKESGGGTRKKSRNLWVYEKATGKKRFSITTMAGAKIQPYFDVPPPSDPNLYYFRVQGEQFDGAVRVWIPKILIHFLEKLLGSCDGTVLSEAILKLASEMPAEKTDGKLVTHAIAEAEPILLSPQAYEKLQQFFPGVSDSHRIQLFVTFLAKSMKVIRDNPALGI